MLIFKGIESIAVPNKQKHVILIKRNVFDSRDLSQIGGKIKYLIESFPNEKLEVIIDIQSNIFKDNLVIMILEYIIYSALKNSDFKLHLRYSPEFTNHYHSRSWLEHSLLKEFLNCKLDKQRFIYKMETEKNVMEMFLKNKKYDEKTNPYIYFRQRLNYSKKDNKNNVLGEKLIVNIAIFLNLAKIYENSDFSYEIISMIMELCGNVLEHSKSDFIIEIQVVEANRVLGKDNSGKAVNITLLSLSDKFLYSDLLTGFNDGDLSELTKLTEAHEYHKDFFDDFYTVEDFMMISAFQRGISSRANQLGSGGTGLTEMLNIIYNKIYFEKDIYCYVLSNKNVLEFNKKDIFEKDKEIGFNENSNYTNEIPNMRNISKTYFPIQGTGFCFQLYKEDLND